MASCPFMVRARQCKLRCRSWTWCRTLMRLLRARSSHVSCGYLKMMLSTSARSKPSISIIFVSEHPRICLKYRSTPSEPFVCTSYGGYVMSSFPKYSKTCSKMKSAQQSTEHGMTYRIRQTVPNTITNLHLTTNRCIKDTTYRYRQVVAPKTHCTIQTSSKHERHNAHLTTNACIKDTMNHQYQLVA